MTERFKYFGFEGNAELQDAYGSIGVRVNGVSMLHRVYDVGRRLEAAGAQGIAVGDINRSDVGILQDARMLIETDAIGSRFYLRGKLHAPSRYLVPDKPAQVVRHGQFGASLETVTH